MSIHAILPLIDLCSFDREYCRFWTWVEKRERSVPPTGILAENPSFLPLLFAVLFGGAVSCPNEELKSQFNLAPRSAISSQLCEAAIHTQSLVAFPRNPTLYSLMSFVIVQNLLVREEEPLAACSYISVALRVAQAMGLHRDGSNFGLEPTETEMRRRIWWHIIHTDVMTSIPSALPPSCLSDSIYDARMICEVKDSYIGKVDTLEFELPRERFYGNMQSIYSPSMDLNILDVRLMVAVDRYTITSMLKRILRRQFDTMSMNNNEFRRFKEEIDVLESRIHARIDQLGKIFNREIREDSFDEAGFIKWAQLLLKLMVHKTYCVLYQPLVRDAHCKIWAQVRPE